MRLCFCTQENNYSTYEQSTSAVFKLQVNPFASSGKPPLSCIVIVKLIHNSCVDSLLASLLAVSTVSGKGRESKD